MIKVYTLGKFHLLVNDNPGIFGKRLSNAVRLFLLIITNLDTGISKNELIYQLFYSQEKESDLSGNLRITLFRLRKSLRDMGIVCPDGSDYILVQDDVYYWNPEIPIWVDAIEFTKVASAYLADNCQDLKQGQQAVELYTGEYLPVLNTDEWVIARQFKLFRLYDAVFHKLYLSFLQQSAYQKAYDLASKSANLYPFEEYQMFMVDCLLSMNSYNKAFQLYAETTELYFKELGLEPSDNMKERLDRMNDSLNHSSLSVSKIHNVLKEDTPAGSYYCSFPSFMDNCHFVSRFIERSGQTAYILIATLEDSNHVPLDPKDEKTRHISELLKDTIQHSLRKGDVFSSYNMLTFSLLLMCTNDIGCDIVIQRIQTNFKKRNPYKKIRITFRKFSVQTPAPDSLPAASALYGNQEICVCIDGYDSDNNVIEGRTYHRYDDQPTSFSSFNDFFLKLNTLFDHLGAPQSDRAFNSLAGKKAFVPKIDTPPKYSVEDIMTHRGNLLTFCLKVTQRRNLTWQGSIEIKDTGKISSFHSELQLIYEISNLLSK